MLNLADCRYLGLGLVRPECVLVHRSGLLFAADWTDPGGVAIVTPTGRVVRHLAKDPPRHLRPNGIALEPDGSFLLAELGAETGGVWRLQPDGTVEPVLMEVDGRPLPPTNYVHLDGRGRLWVTVSTRHQPRHVAARPDVADGFVILVEGGPVEGGPVEGGKPQVVAGGLGYTNECVVAPDGDWLWVNETFTRRLSRFRIKPEGLGPRETVTTFGPGSFPDGLTFDVEGNVWITALIGNRVIVVTPDGRQEVVLEDTDPTHIAAVEAAWQAGTLDRSLLDVVPKGPLKNVSSLALTGPDRRTIALGCLLGDSLALIDGPAEGALTPHWDHDIAPREALLEEAP